MGCILSAASCNKWINETVFGSDYRIPVGDIDNGLYFLPYLSGERCPHNDGDVRGAFVGITHATTREDMQRAVFEGVSFAVKDCLSLCPGDIKKATVCGGGTKNLPWMRILSDVLGIELSVIQNEGPALGGALLAAGLSIKPTAEYTLKPDETTAGIYREKYRKFKELYPLLKPFYKEDRQ